MALVQWTLAAVTKGRVICHFLLPPVAGAAAAIREELLLLRQSLLLTCHLQIHANLIDMTLSMLILQITLHVWHAALGSLMRTRPMAVQIIACRRVEQPCPLCHMYHTLYGQRIPHAIDFMQMQMQMQMLTRC